MDLPRDFKTVDEMLDEYEEAVRSPGKFEGEALYVPFYYDLMLEGWGPDEEDSYPEGGGWVGIFNVGDEEANLFVGLKNKDKVAIFERSDGFVEEVGVGDAYAMLDEIAAIHEEEGF